MVIKIGENINDQKILDEKETRKRIMKHAKLVGCEKDMFLLLSEADNKMRLCGNEKERKDISSFYITKIYYLLGGGGELYIDGKLVIKDD